MESKIIKILGSKHVEMSAEEVKNHFLNAGCWPFIKQRPYDVLPIQINHQKLFLFLHTQVHH
jgi:Na+-transporting NADH:ubiquinone oxidoreductase subunit NqrA